MESLSLNISARLQVAPQSSDRESITFVLRVPVNRAQAT
jgi:hypothetical protein